ncbi:hypothetical protein OAO01_08375, partial [Oligoflexia bacterium]|nr:hypothetical protein [Oligoflexia bacterium]
MPIDGPDNSGKVNRTGGRGSDADANPFGELNPLAAQAIDPERVGGDLYRDKTTGIYLLARDPTRDNFHGKGNGTLCLARDGWRIPKETLLVSADYIATATPWSESGIGIDEEMAATIRQAAQAAGISDLAFFRSSGYEDSAGHTAAGLYSSKPQFLNISNELLSFTIMEVVNSGFSWPAQAFNEKHGHETKPIAMCIQQAQCSPELKAQGRFAPHWSFVVDSSH